jgi:hypothetical protein
VAEASAHYPWSNALDLRVQLPINNELWASFAL